MKEMRRIDRELFEGVKYRHYDWMLVRQLIMAGANPNIRDEYGQNLLYHIQNAEVARGLIKAGANLENRDENECTPLFAVTEPEMAECCPDVLEGRYRKAERRSKEGEGGY